MRAKKCHYVQKLRYGMHGAMRAALGESRSPPSVATRGAPPLQAARRRCKLSPTAGEDCAMADDHHADDHDHGSELSEMQLRVRALETILTEKGYIDPAALDRIVEACETQIGPHNGARVVARAWVDPEFKRRLLEDASEAANSLGHVSPVGA